MYSDEQAKNHYLTMNEGKTETDWTKLPGHVKRQWYGPDDKGPTGDEQPAPSAPVNELDGTDLNRATNTLAEMKSLIVELPAQFLKESQQYEAAAKETVANVAKLISESVKEFEDKHKQFIDEMISAQQKFREDIKLQTSKLAPKKKAK